MGADGGLVWLRLRPGVDLAQLEHHVWFLWRLRNESAYAYKGDFVEPCEWCPEWPHVEGAYGTDCEFTLNWLIDIVEFCDSAEPLWGLEDPRDLTFADLEQSLLTTPDFQLWRWSEFNLKQNYERFPWWMCSLLGPITESIVRKLQSEIPRSDGFVHRPWVECQVPERFMNVTLREWASGLANLIEPESDSRETWT